ncbi:thymidylate kinase protein [Diplodia corticola]|uniref:Thymidylate kinase protein n=1 Tax=Diplodia corticola TaxID=236234 RepID=A0A1J9S1F3_9PEZI|nr:thymidylate kinase protein [Diplodia corticola]OJD33493.1 thymidylate kinase protein [Diplodia corticola]
MTAHVPARQPFAALDGPRLRNLTSAKNRQNSISASLSFPASGKQSKYSPSSKRRHTTSPFDGDLSSENADPAVFDSPTKRSKNLDGSPKKVSKFILGADAAPASSSSARRSTPLSTVEKPRASTVPAQSSISTSRGSPKNKRAGLLSKRRTTRIDPPSFDLSPRRNSGVPFSIDAALSGTIPDYAPPPKPAARKPASLLDESMPKGWFFEIHEDSPEEEATNMMEHSATTLDISSDDDCDTRAETESRERGKENIPPPDYYLTSSSRSAGASDASAEPRKAKPRRKFEKDAMEEDRSPLSALPASDFFGEGLDANSYVIVDGTAPEKPSRLSKECTFDDIPTKEGKDAASATVTKSAKNIGSTAKDLESTASEVSSPEESSDFAVFDETATETPDTNASVKV